MELLRRIRSLGVRAVAAVTALALLVVVLFAFGGTLNRSTDVEAEAALAQARVDQAAELAAAGKRELAFVQSDEFVEWQARSVGFGEEDEHPFKLDADAPPPRPIVPIGPLEPERQPAAPFDAWMALLFGA